MYLTLDFDGHGAIRRLEGICTCLVRLRAFRRLEAKRVLHIRLYASHRGLAMILSTRSGTLSKNSCAGVDPTGSIWSSRYWYYKSKVAVESGTLLGRRKSCTRRCNDLREQMHYLGIVVTECLGKRVVGGCFSYQRTIRFVPIIIPCR